MVLLGSGLSALIEGTVKRYAVAARTVNYFFTVLGFILLLPWAGVAVVLGSCH
jgi:hypothetical protein